MTGIYNKKYGWAEGDLFLKTIAKALHQDYKDALIFRIQGDDFAVLNCSGIDFCDTYEKCEKSSIECSHIQIDLQKQDIASVKSLEKFMQSK